MKRHEMFVCLLDVDGVDAAAFGFDRNDDAVIHG
jgi:hypothetical protein